MTSDLETLIEMGFSQDRAELAVTAASDLSGAIDWLERNQERSMEEIKAALAAAPSSVSDEAPSLQPGEVAKSLVCEDCDRKLRSTAQAEWHASKTGHENFAESTEEIAPLTEQEKKQKLEDLREKLVQKRAAQSEQDKEDKKRNEQIRMKATQESQDIREALQKKERIKEAQAKRAEKKADEEARKRVLAKLEADKLERRRKAEEQKALRTGQAPPMQSAPSALATSSGPVTSRPASAYTETRLALQTSTGRITRTFPVETTLFEIVHELEKEGIQVNSFAMNFPKRIYDKTEFGMTLKEAGLTPSAALIVR